jgi:hypothetical protein
MSTEACEPTIEQVEKTSSENEPDSGVKEIARGVRIGTLK